MDAAVRLAFTHASPGDTVLLSPACASFDMFKNYKHRGEVFAASVASLAKADEKRGEHPNA
jgi:UDP-N-acetylmuramoylalanine--D-glutamate ligase